MSLPSTMTGGIWRRQKRVSLRMILNVVVLIMSAATFNWNSCRIWQGCSDTSLTQIRTSKIQRAWIGDSLLSIRKRTPGDSQAKLLTKPSGPS
ncbi:hypothetical protein F5880DRAFT_1566129, partial [Lentinula raphanica]